MKHILITGASSGIGRALALHYANKGICLGLIGLNSDRLAEVKAAVEKMGATCRIASLDITDEARIKNFIHEFDKDMPIDLLVANAGILDGRKKDQQTEDADTARRVIEINLIGSLNTLHAILPAMQKRSAGHIVLVSSLAAFLPLADAPAYSASKAGLVSYGLGLRSVLARTGIKVSVVTPGYVRTQMTELHMGAHPFEISAESAALRIANGISRNKAIIGFPTQSYLSSRFASILPEFLRLWGTRGLRFYVGAKTPSSGRDPS